MTLWQLVSHLDGLANGTAPRTPSGSPVALPPISLLTAKTYLKLAKWLESYRSSVDLKLLREEGMCFPDTEALPHSQQTRSNYSALLLTRRVSDDAILFAASFTSS